MIYLDVRNIMSFSHFTCADPQVRAALQSMGNTGLGQDVPAVIIIDANCVVQMTNPSAADLFGYV